MSYKVVFSHQAAKDMKRLDRTNVSRIQARREELTQDPFSPRTSRQMETIPENRYTRVGDWRIIYQVKEAGKTINIGLSGPGAGPTDSGPARGELTPWAVPGGSGLLMVCAFRGKAIPQVDFIVAGAYVKGQGNGRARASRRVYLAPRRPNERKLK